MTSILNKYKNSSDKKELTDTVYLMILQGLNYVAPLLVLPYLMVVLSAEKFGIIGFGLAVCQYLTMIVDFGFQIIATKRIAIYRDERDKMNRIFSATMDAKMLLLFLSFIVLVLISLIPKFAVYRSAMFIMFLIVIGNAFNFIWLFQGLGKIRTVSIINTLSKLIILPLTFVFVKSSDDYLTSALIQSLVVVVGSAVTVIWIRKDGMADWIRCTKDDIKLELKESYPIFLSNASTIVYTTLFVVILGYFTTADEVGRYSATDRVMRAFISVLFISVVQAFYPKVSRMGQNDRNAALRLISRLMIIVAAGMSAIFVFMFFGSSFVERFLGESYRGTETLFRIMSFCPVFIGIGGVMGQLGLIALGGELEKKRYTRVYYAAAVIAIAFMFILTPKYGAAGTAVTVLLTEISVCMMIAYSFFKSYKKDIKA